MSFELDGNAVRRIFDVWNIPVPKANLVLFAFRGCLPDETPKGWVRSVKLTPVALDYKHMRCTIGIWNQKTNKIFAAAGSTVPHRENVLKAAARKGSMRGRGANQMEPGFYSDLRKGEHLQGKLMGHAALRQTGYRFYRRSHHAPPYVQTDPLYFGNPYDNLHGAWNLDEHEPGFRSAGCLVVAGMPHSPRLPDSGPNRGAWKIFHDLIYAASQKNFSLLLLPASEAQKALKEKKAKPRFCYGSRGVGVAAYRAWNASGSVTPS